MGEKIKIRRDSLCNSPRCVAQWVPYLYRPKHAKDCWHGAVYPQNEAEEGVEAELKAEVPLCLTT